MVNVKCYKKKCFQCRYTGNHALRTHMSREEAVLFTKRTVAMEYYKQQGDSIGYFAQIANMTEEEFIRYLGQHHVSVFSNLTMKPSVSARRKMRKAIVHATPLIILCHIDCLELLKSDVPLTERRFCVVL